MMARSAFDRLAARLAATPGIADWKLRHRVERQTQLYVIDDRPEAARVVAADRLDVTVYVDRDGGRGASNVTLFPGSPEEWGARLAAAVFRAGLQSNPPFVLPGPQRYRRVPLADRAIAEDAEDRARVMVDRLLRALRRERGVRLSSAEVFLTTGTTHFRNSRGAEGEAEDTVAEVLFVVLAGEGVSGTEAVEAIERRRLADLDLDAAAQRAAKFARDSLQATAPTPRRSAAVVFSGDALKDGTLSDFWQPFRFHASGEAAYRKLSRFRPGELVTPGRIAGEPLGITADPELRYGTASAPFDRDGLALRRAPLIEEGRLARYWTTKEYADLLKVEATGALTNLVVPPGRTAEAELVRDGPTLQVVAFSWFNPSALTGDFATEIRLGYERRRGRERPVKGGAVQGNLFEAFRRATFAREVDWLGSYHGPRSIRCESLAVGEGSSAATR